MAVLLELGGVAMVPLRIAYTLRVVGTARLLVPSGTAHRPGAEVLGPAVDGIAIAGCEPGCCSVASLFVGLE